MAELTAEDSPDIRELVRERYAVACRPGHEHRPRRRMLLPERAV
jgi:hypothetical protein